MGVVFFTQPGKAVGIKTDGAAPSRAITLQPDGGFQNSAVMGNIDNIAYAAIEWLTGGSLTSDTGEAARNGAGKLLNGGGYTAPEIDSYSDTLQEARGGHDNRNTKENNARAVLSLGEYLSGNGIITSIQVSMTDTITGSNAVRVEAGNQLAMGDATVSGIIFDSTMCDSAGTSGVNHGLDYIFEFYHIHRVANPRKAPSNISLSIGTTKLTLWLYSMSIAPGDFTYRMWNWSYAFKISPYYTRPKPRTVGGNDMKNVDTQGNLVNRLNTTGQNKEALTATE
jgi:hypothetical protein